VRERLITLACACGALLVFATLFLRGPGPAEQRTAPPTTLERGDSGLFAAWRWLAGEGVRTISLRERFGTLARRPDLPPVGNLLIVTLPVQTPMWAGETAALDRWVRTGNTLLVAAALSDRPGWAINGYSSTDLNRLTGLEFTPLVRQPGGSAPWPPGWAGHRVRPRAGLPEFMQLVQPLESTLVPNRGHPYLTGVNSAVAVSDYMPELYDVRVPRDGFVLSLARQREMGEGVLWVRPSGEGTIIVSGFGSLFTNRLIGRADNARLLANIVATSVGPQGAVLFDDEHQGLSAAYDPARFYRDPRLYETLGVLLVLWLSWVLGSTQLQAPATRTGGPREAQLVRATGSFLARVLQPSAAAQRMFEHFFRRLQARLRRETHRAETPWEWLEHHPRLPPQDVRQLREWYAQACSGEQVPLVRLHNLIVNTERRLAE
jgi:hypothetical protein